jgi:hypothetical protein
VEKIDAAPTDKKMVPTYTMDTSFCSTDASFYTHSAEDYDSEEDLPIPPAVPLWPSYVAARPPIASLIKQSLLAVTPPAPLPKEYTERLAAYDIESVKKDTALKTLQESIQATEKEFNALPAPAAAPVRAWSSKTSTGAASAQRRIFLQEKLAKEKESVLTLKKEIQKYQDDHSNILQIRKTHQALHTLYKDYKKNQEACYDFETPIFVDAHSSAVHSVLLAGSASSVDAHSSVASKTEPVKEEPWQVAVRVTALYS